MIPFLHPWFHQLFPAKRRAPRPAPKKAPRFPLFDEWEYEVEFNDGTRATRVFCGTADKLAAVAVIQRQLRPHGHRLIDIYPRMENATP